MASNGGHRTTRSGGVMRSQSEGPITPSPFSLRFCDPDPALLLARDGGDAAMKDIPKPECSPLCSATHAYGRFDAPWKHELDCPVRVAWAARQPSGDEILAQAKNPDGTRRFYPPFEHPATAQLREQIARLEEFPESRDRDLMLNRLRLDMARFEYGEDRAKRDYISVSLLRRKPLL